jgi:RNA polymerase nonessential primary-like sigma factor
VQRALRHLSNHPPADGRDATLDDVAHLIDRPVDDVARLARLQEHVLSLDAPLDGDPSVTIGDALADEDAVAPELLLHHSALERSVAAWLGELPERQRRVIERRYGLNGAEVATLEELSREVGVTRERVRQIQAEALERLRARLAASGLDRDALL